MQRLIGYWSWNLGEQALVRDDGARLRYIEPVDDDTDPRSRWFRFLVSCDQGETPLLVQHRLAGFNGQYRELYWRADFSRGPAPSSFAQWAAFERIAADGLACWPEETFGELPDYVAVEGGWSDGAFRTDWYRIYERTRVQSFLLQGRLPERDTVERHWRFQPLNPAISAPSPSEVARWHSLQDIRHGLALMIDRGPALVCKDRAILLEEDEYKRLHATYIDDDFVSDRYVITGLYRTQEDRWGVGDDATVAIGARRLRDFRAAEEDGPSGLFGLLSEEPKRDGQGTENWAADPLLVERAAQSFAAALFKVPEGAFSPERASAPPLLIALTQGGFQAGYLQQRLQIARSLGTDEFVAAFANEVPPSATIQLKPGLDFDAETARLRWGDRVLAFERTLEPGPSGARLLLRCSDGDMSWPIVIQQSRHRHHELRAWSVDHDVSLAQWRREEGGDLPRPRSVGLHAPIRRGRDPFLARLSCDRLRPAATDHERRLLRRRVAGHGAGAHPWTSVPLLRISARPRPGREGLQAGATCDHRALDRLSPAAALAAHRRTAH
jgi:hypothetical protein